MALLQGPNPNDYTEFMIKMGSNPLTDVLESKAFLKDHAPSILKQKDVSRLPRLTSEQRDCTIGVISFAHSLISDKANWCQHHGAVDKNGEAATPTSPNAVRWCALGAIDKAREVLRVDASNRLADIACSLVADRLYEYGVPSVNDMKGHADALRVFEATIGALSNPRVNMNALHRYSLTTRQQQQPIEMELSCIMDDDDMSLASTCQVETETVLDWVEKERVKPPKPAREPEVVTEEFYKKAKQLAEKMPPFAFSVSVMKPYFDLIKQGGGKAPYMAWDMSKKPGGQLVMVDTTV